MPAEFGRSVNYYIRRYSELEDQKRPWLQHYQALAQIFLTRKMDFTRMLVPGEFLQADVFDNTGQFAAYLMASIFLSMLWPDSARTFEICPVRRLKGLPNVEAYFRYVTEEMHEVMENPRAGLQLALMEHFLDQGIFGTSGVSVFEGEENDAKLPVVYDSWSIKTMCIAENAQGFVDTVYFKRELTVRQVLEKYSKPGDVVSAKVREQAKNQRFDDKVEILQVIEPKEPEPGKKGVAGMSVRTLHIDKTNNVIMREGAVEEMPVLVARMFKTMDEPYGRSPGMLALPDAQSLNALTEAVLVAAEKQLDPPLAVLDDGRLGGGAIDTSASAINVFNTAGRMGNDKPVFPIFTVGENQSAKEQQERLEQKIMQAFQLDRLLDLNNKTMMTAYETSIRNRMRGEALGSVFARQQMEVLTPLVERTFNILFRRGHFGIVETGIGARLRRAWAKIIGAEKVVVPQAVIDAAAAGLDVFEVEYISPASRFMQSEKLQGIFTAIDAIVALQPAMPDIIDNVDPDKTAREIYEYSGAPKHSLRVLDDVKKIRAERASRQAAVDQLGAATAVADIGAKAAQARAALGTTGGKNG